MIDSTAHTTPLTLERLVIVQLRNLRDVDLEPALGLNVLAGGNGQGKTSVLEAIYLLLTSRSFRTARLADLVQHGHDVASVRGTLREGALLGSVAREQSVGLQGAHKVLRLDGEPPRSSTHYAMRSPVVLFEPQQLLLSTGPARPRRQLLDRLSLFMHPDLAVHRSRYQRALKERQRLLTDRSRQAGHSAALDAYELLLAEHGAAITRARSAAALLLERQSALAFEQIGPGGTRLQARYVPGGSIGSDEARRQLHDRRARDAHQKSASFGPQRDDLLLSLDDQPVRVVASQGQHRMITLALKLAEIQCLRDARGLLPVLLLDDVSSELDPERTAALFSVLHTSRSQIFLTTTRPALITTVLPDADGRRDWLVHAGRVAPATT